ncbi:MAG: hypothetical protein ABH824_06585 [Nanoarchaeota archaeon]|nr:hypothetical protein [Nanoarchaeota archaeon]MBU1632027.1 hypothetical protein [Nanoarchaeota archaeon]MBU1875965.1 hypothetical protein [Nanoarchaeota archaeon]
MELAITNELIKEISKSDSFKKWKVKHPGSFPSHLFCSLDSDYNIKDSLEVGFFDSNTKKITVFVMKDGNVSAKDEDDVFKKENEKVEMLKQNDVKINFEKAKNILEENLKKFFPKKDIGDGFIVLQTIKGKTLWNFTFITKTLEFVNLKINASSGEIDSHQVVELIDKGITK